MAARAEKPDAANGLRKAFRALMKHAIEVGLRADDPTREVRAIRVKSAGFIVGPTTKSHNLSGTPQ